MLRRQYGFIIHWRSANASSPIKKYGMGWSSPGRGSGCGMFNVPFKIFCLSWELLKIWACTVSTNFNPHEFVGRIHQGHDDDGEKSLVVVVGWAGFGWLLNPDMFPIKAPWAWQKFQRVAKLQATSFHSSSVLGQLITSSLYSSAMAPQTSRTIRPMLLLDTQKPCIRVLKLMPVARYLRVMASFNPGVKARLKLESVFSSLGVNLASSSWNMAGSILSMFLNSLGSSFSSSTLRFSY